MPRGLRAGENRARDRGPWGPHVPQVPLQRPGCHSGGYRTGGEGALQGAKPLSLRGSRSLPYPTPRVGLETGLRAYPPRTAALAAANGVENLLTVVVKGTQEHPPRKAVEALALPLPGIVLASRCGAVESRVGKRRWKDPDTGREMPGGSALDEVELREEKELAGAGWERVETGGETYWCKPDSRYLYPRGAAHDVQKKRDQG